MGTFYVYLFTEFLCRLDIKLDVLVPLCDI